MPEDTLHVDVSHVNGLVVVIVAGEINVASAPVLREALEGLRSGQRVVLDLTGLVSRDSTTATLLMAHSKRMSHSGGALLIRCPSDVGWRRPVRTA